MVRLIWIIFNLTFIRCQIMFVGRMVCVFASTNSMQTNNFFSCVTQCISDACQIFYFDEKTSQCSFYTPENTCDSENDCRYVKAYFNSDYTGKIVAPSGARYQVLKGIKNPFLRDKCESKNGELSPAPCLAFTSSSENQPEIILTTKLREIVSVTGKYGSSKLVGWPEPHLLVEMNGFKSKIQLHANNIVTYLTSGVCISYYNCYESIEKFKQFSGIENRVFGVVSDSIFDIDNFKKNAAAFNWGVIVSGRTSLSTNFRKLLSLYGVSVNKYVGPWNLTIDDNICESLNPREYDYASGPQA